MSSTRAPWEIIEGFETFPPKTAEYLYIEVNAPDYVLAHTLAHTDTESDFAAMGIQMSDLTDYKEGQHVFLLSFVMQNEYPALPTKMIKFPTSAYLNIATGTGIHILVYADKRKKKYKRSMQNMVSDQQ